jgi:hypothetical protein
MFIERARALSTVAVRRSSRKQTRNNFLRNKVLRITFLAVVCTLIYDLAIPIGLQTQRRLSVCSEQRVTCFDLSVCLSGFCSLWRRQHWYYREAVRWRTYDLSDLRSAQFDSLRDAIYKGKDGLFKPVLGKFNMQDLCSPACLSGRTFENKYLRDQKCLNSNYLRDVLAVDYTKGSRRSLAVVVPYYTGDLPQLPHLFSKKLCEITTDAGLITISISKRAQFDHLNDIPHTSCFQSVDHVVLKSSLSLNYALGAPVTFQSLLRHKLETLTQFDYFMWLEPDNIPLKDGWLEELITISRQNTPYLIKGAAPASLDEQALKNILRAENVTMTSHFMHINGNALYGSWNKVFLELLHDVVTSLIYNQRILDHKKHAFDSFISWFLVNDACTFKALSAYIVYSNFILNSPRLHVIADHSDSATLFIHKPKSCAMPSNMDIYGAFISQTDVECYNSMDEKTFQFMAERNFDHKNLPRTFKADSVPVRRPGREMSTCLETYQGFKSFEQLFSEASDEECRDAVLRAKLNDSQSKKILIVFVFSSKQWQELDYAISRWRSSFSPCDGTTTDKFGLLFIQSDPARLSIYDKLSAFLESHRSLLTCFAKPKFQFVEIPDTEDGYQYGPPMMFREMMLGKSSAGFDYALQLEPDVLPIQKNWLDRVSEAVRDDFWVKGSLGLYFDQDDWQQGCIQGISLGRGKAIRTGPIGPRLLHINGNALYSLSDEFKSLVEDFFDSAKESPYGLCERQDRMRCSLSGLCSGSFDTSLAEFMLLSAKLPQHLTKYRFSDLFVNDVSEFIPLSRLKYSTVFMHKPWKSTEVLRTMSQRDNRLIPLVNELDEILYKI